jgi:hypothetical protein
MELNWVREYNKLFEAINQQGLPTYFSGNRFIGIIREFDNNFADYNQYISYRQEKGLSTSRKNYYYDILMLFKEDVRNQIIARIWEEVENSKEEEKEKHTQMETLKPQVIDLWFEDKISIVEKEEPLATTETIESPTVFISYSWDDEDHKNWILGLATKLIENGVTVILDRYDLKPGKNMLHFMDEAVRKSDKVLMIFTENYKLKAEKRDGGVGYEYSIFNVELYKKITSNEKYIPILKNGTFETSIPDFIQQFIAINMTDNFRFDEKFNELLLAIYDKPQIEKPQLGKRPSFMDKKPNS